MQGEKRMPLVEDARPPESGPPPEVDPAVVAAYWRKTSGLMWLMLAIWFFASFVVHIFAPSLNQVKVLGFPLGFYMAAQGSLIIFVVSLFWFAKRQNQIDEEFGVQEE
jgi:putative solute:sodium symporter small subunit